MLSRIMLIVVGLFVLSFSQANENWNGWGDTAEVKNFYKDTTVYSGWFKLSAFENSVYSVYFADTSAAGFGSDSCAFEWGIQTGHPSWISTYSNRKYETMARLLIDTVNTTTAANFVLSDMVLDGDYNYTFQKVKIDSLSVSGWAYQQRPVTPPWDAYFRFWAHGITGNKNAKNLKLIFQVSRRVSAKAN